MPKIPENINGVTVEFKSSVNREVTELMIGGLEWCIRPDIAAGHELEKILISSASEPDAGHAANSNHYRKRAVDISCINGKHIIESYNSDDAVTAIVNAVQEAFEGYAHRRENFGPHFCKKLGKPKPDQEAGHKNHVHHSVNQA